LWDSLFDRGGADHASIAHFNEDGTLGGGDEIRGKDDRAQLVGRTVVGTIEHDRDCNSLRRKGIFSGRRFQCFKVSKVSKATRGSHDSARITKIREILERAKRDIEGLDKA